MELQQTRREVKIRVDKKIINLLSRATYETFPRVLRELISNSYDADASKVSVDIDLKKSEIRLEDNGNGMSSEQFNYFLTIAAQTRSQRRSPRYQRERIGQFGVGFLAAFPFCEQMTVETTAAASQAVITAVVPCESYLKERKSDADLPTNAVEEIPIPVSEVIDPRQRRQHYTKITLKGLTSVAHQYFRESKSSASKRVMAMKTRPPIERLKWDLQDTVVLDYPNRSAVASALGQKPIGMEVFLNGDRLFRNEPPGEILSSSKLAGRLEGINIDGFRVRYVITSPWEPVQPVELRGLRIYVNNVAVGPREMFGLATHGGALPRLYWISGEIHIDHGAREYLALDREGFANAPGIEALYDYFRSEVRKVEGQISHADTKLKEVEAGLGVPIRGGGPRPRLLVGSKRKLVDRHMRELKAAGFRVERVSSEAPSRNFALARQKPIEIDRKSKTIRIYETHPDFKDTVKTSLGEFSVDFDDWDYSKSPFPACKPIDKKTITVNTEYPLFQSKSFGRLFLRAAVTMTLLSEESKEKRGFVRDVLLKWVDEFRDILD